MKKKIILRAPVFTISGYGVHSRQIFRWLETKLEEYDLWVQTLMWGNTSWMVDKNMMDGLVGRIMNHTAPCPPDPDISIQVQLPNEWDPKIARFNIGVTAGIETDKCNPEWINKINEMDLIVVPSEHTKRTFESSGTLQKKVVVIPEAFIDEIETANVDLMPLPEIKTDFNFLVVGQLTGNNDVTDRKNTYRTLKWVSESFHKDRDVGIVLKTNSARNSATDRERTKDIINQVLSSFRREGVPNVPVYLIHGELTNKEMAALYRHPKIKALVALTRGEGFGLPILEAAASDLPVIATDWSGHLDFMNLGKFIKVDYDLIDVHETKIDNQLFMRGSKWANPREISTKKALKKFRESSDIPNEWAKDLGAKIRKEFSQQAINEKYNELLSNVVIW